MTHRAASEVKTPKVSVIVPVYNTEKYVERAIVCLMEQTLQDAEFIIIDDGSKDNSLNIIKQVIARYSERAGQVTLISRENRGVAATRAQGMELASGDYVIHLDSDDWAELNWLEAMHSKAIEENADVVVCDYHTFYATKATYIKQPVGIDGVDCVKKLFTGDISNSNWNKLVLRTIFIENGIYFHSGYNLGEDLFVTTRVFLNSKKIVAVNCALYHYNQCNISSLTFTVSFKSLDDYCEIVEMINSELISKSLEKELSKEFTYLKLDLKALLAYHSKGSLFRIKHALNVYPDSNALILKSKFRRLKIYYVLDVLGILWLIKLISKQGGVKCVK
ncbi:glycosyltransferase family 2 protein [Shewanella oncorhynchi]|uniref:glycosyltransferase family 2 protein n=1 Tax=Shewanella oncorhynchi TaxID=2726434 RepID=UPI003D7AD7A5